MKSVFWALFGLCVCAVSAFAHPNHDEAVSVPCKLYPAAAEPREGLCRVHEAAPYVVVGIEFAGDGVIAAVSGAVNLDLAQGALSTGSGETLADGPVAIEAGPEGAFGAGALWTWRQLHLEFLPDHPRATRDVGALFGEWSTFVHTAVVLAVLGAVAIGFFLVFGRGKHIDNKGEVGSQQR